MNVTLFTVICKNSECENQFMTSSPEHTLCPCCGEESIEYLDNTIVATYDKKEDLTESTPDISDVLTDKSDVLTAILIASTYASGDCVIARYDDNQGFRLNLKESNFTEDIVKLLNLSSTNDLISMIYEELNDEEHALLIYDPVFDCIERESYTDEYGYLYESGQVKPSTAKKFYSWISNNHDYIKEMLS